MSRWRKHATHLGGLVAGQVLVQALNAATGLLLVWKLPRTEYAWLTIMNSMVAAVMVLGDPALGTGLQSIGGRIAQDRGALSTLVATALRLRWLILLLCCSLALPWTSALLWKNGATPLQAGLLCTAGLLGLPAALGYSIQSVVSKLQGRLRLLVSADLWASASRLVVTTLLVVAFPWAVLALLATALSQIAQYRLGRRQTAPLLDFPAVHSAANRSELLKLERSMFLFAVFQCVQGQVSIWLLGLHGNTGAVAEFGALMRFGILFAWLAPVFQYWIIPALARTQDHGLLRLRMRKALGGTVLALAVLIFAGSATAGHLIYFLGPNYRHLAPQIPLALVFLTLNALASAAWWLNNAKGWTNLSWLVPPVSLGLMVLLIMLLKPADTHGILLFMSLALLPSLLLAITQSVLSTRSKADAAK